MSLSLNLYFDPNDLQGMVNRGATGIFVKCFSEKIPNSQESGQMLFAIAVKHDVNGETDDYVIGCPTPCDPDMTGNSCNNESALLLQTLKDRFQNINLLQLANL